ncbi:MAG: hypothetical protein MAGBODY4_00530 [Candidatus Marinimicrobia bacterium]|nr:hypothetical protein [Candidatus Neomarinimicrobiota bacterium]
MSRGEIDIFGLLPGHLDNSVRQVLLGVFIDPFGFYTRFHYNRPEIPDIISLGHFRTFIRIDKPPVELAGILLVFPQSIFQMPAIVFHVKSDRRHFLIQIFQDFHCLIRQGVLPGGGGIFTPIEFIQDQIGENHDDEHDNDAKQAAHPILCRFTPKELKEI